MSRTLVLLRHAKAEPASGWSDVDRRLTPRGRADAGAAGAWLSTHGLRPDLVICSPARRTRQTWHGVALALPPGRREVRYERSLYDGSARDLLRAIATTPDEVRTVLLIGHNPAVSELSALLDPAGATADSGGLRTCGLAVHEVAGSWAECDRASQATAHTARA